MPVNSDDVNDAVPAVAGTSQRADLLNLLLKGLITDIAESGGSPTAASVGVTATGGISSTNVQAALAELDSKKLAAAAVGVSVASLVSGVVPSSQLPPGVAGITSFNGRTEVAAVPEAGDYSTSMVSAGATATGYTPTAATAAGHLAGIGTALVGKVPSSDPALTDARALLASTTLPTHKLTVKTTTAPYTVLVADAGTVLVVTSAGTVTVPAAATLTAGFACLVVNDGSSGSVVLDGPGATPLSLAVGDVATIWVVNSKIRALKGASTVLS
jgi:hypothetical protein